MYLKEALKYLVELGKKKTVEIDGLNYSNEGLFLLEEPLPTEIITKNLSGIVDYLKSNIDDINFPVMVHVQDHLRVVVSAALSKDMSRKVYMQCRADFPSVLMDSYMNAENFNIMLQSCFLRADDRDIVLSVVGNIREENVRQTGDDGVSQVVTAKTGIARKGEVDVPNPVILRPFRTFPEVEQPASKFVLRMADGPKAALFEADGGAWKAEAMKNIKKYLEAELEEVDAVIIA